MVINFQMLNFTCHRHYKNDSSSVRNTVRDKIILPDYQIVKNKFVEKMGLEPTTPSMPYSCSSQLSYIPN
jgi:hypothetical protein